MAERVLICYGTRKGTTAEMAEAIAGIIMESGAEVDIVNLKDKKVPAAIEDYNLIVVGSGIQAGSWTSEPRDFIKKNLGLLSQKRVALFVVCLDAASEDKCDDAQRNYLDKIVEENPGLNPVSTALLPGKIDFRQHNFVIRKMLKSIISKELPPGEEVQEVMDFTDIDKAREWASSLVSE
ncbi:MAG: flavodoxin domain-containing protein [Promethearchaeota archaeon]